MTFRLSSLRTAAAAAAAITALVSVPLASFGATASEASPSQPTAAHLTEAQSLDAKSDCAYGGAFIHGLTAFSAATGHQYACAMVFNNASPTWQAWDTPWSEQDPNPDLNWAKWKAAKPGRRLILTEDMVPNDAPSNWRQVGATGAYDRYAHTLAQNLVWSGLGDSIIRLGHEANYTQGIASVGSSARDFTAWALYWRNIVTTMRAVPGAHFLFDWNILSGYRPIPLQQFYPGDRYVDIISIDQYDGTVDTSWGTTPEQHWNMLWNQPDGLDAVVKFANQHGKALAFPEWSIEPGGDGHGYGNDPYYIDQMARLIATQDVAYQSYWDVQNSWNILRSAPASWVAYRSHFGARGNLQGGAFAAARPTTTAPSRVAPALWVSTAYGRIEKLTANGERTFVVSRGLPARIAGSAVTPDGNGIWRLLTSGLVLPSGSARTYPLRSGSPRPAAAVAIAPSADGRGYWVLSRDGAVSSYGDAPDPVHSRGSLDGEAAAALVPDAARTGYLVLGTGGAVDAYGGARAPQIDVTASHGPVVGAAAAPLGGLWVLQGDGTVTAAGSGATRVGGIRSSSGAHGVAVVDAGSGYYVLRSDGGIEGRGPVTVGRRAAVGEGLTIMRAA